LVFRPYTDPTCPWNGTELDMQRLQNAIESPHVRCFRSIMAPESVVSAMVEDVTQPKIGIVVHLIEWNVGADLRMRQAGTLKHDLIFEDGHVFDQESIDSVQKVLMKLDPGIFVASKLGATMIEMRRIIQVVVE
jgi:hypothetical protein